MSPFSLLIYPHLEYFWTDSRLRLSSSKNILDVDKSEGRTETVWIKYNIDKKNRLIEKGIFSK